MIAKRVAPDVAIVALLFHGVLPRREVAALALGQRRPL